MKEIERKRGYVFVDTEALPMLRTIMVRRGVIHIYPARTRSIRLPGTSHINAVNTYKHIEILCDQNASAIAAL